MSQVGPVVPAVTAATTDWRVRLAMLTGSKLEDGWGPQFSPGDDDTSFGPFQMHEGGALDSLPGSLSQKIAEAEDPVTAVAAMLGSYQGAVAAIDPSLWSTDPEQAAEEAAALAERPAWKTSQDQAYFDQYGPEGSGGSVDQAFAAAWPYATGSSTPATSTPTSPNASAPSGTASATDTGFGLHSIPVIGGLFNDLGTSIGKDIGEVVVTGVILLGGVALIVGGGWRAVSPTAKKVSGQVGQAAQVAAVAA